MWRNAPIWLAMSLVVLLALACTRGGDRAHQPVVEIAGRIYVGGSELNRFIGLQPDSGAALYLLGVDSLRKYQDRIVVVRGVRTRPQSDSLRVLSVRILKQ